MIIIYTGVNNKVCHKVLHWFEEEGIPYCERKITKKKPLTKKELELLLKLSYNGFDDLLSFRSKSYQNIEIQFENLSYNEALNFIINHPKIIKKPIIIDLKKHKLQVGFNKEKIRIFKTREYKLIEKNIYRDKLIY